MINPYEPSEQDTKIMNHIAELIRDLMNTYDVSEDELVEHFNNVVEIMLDKQ